MITIYSPRNVEELDILKRMLSEAGIRFFINNDSFGFLYPSSKLETVGTNYIMVNEDHYPRALKIVNNYLKVVKD